MGCLRGYRQNRTFLPPKEYSPLAVTKKPEIPTELPAGDYNEAVFENPGVEVGVTLHHPHGQMYSYLFVRPVPARMVEMPKNYLLENAHPLLQKMLADEKKNGRPMIVSEPLAHAFVPACADYAYETWIVPEKIHTPGFMPSLTPNFSKWLLCLRKF